MSATINIKDWPVYPPKEGVDELLEYWDATPGDGPHRKKFDKFAPHGSTTVIETHCRHCERQTVAKIYRLRDGFDEGIAKNFKDPKFLVVATRLIRGQTRFMTLYDFLRSVTPPPPYVAGRVPIIGDLTAGVDNPAYTRTNAVPSAWLAVQCHQCKKHGLLRLDGFDKLAKQTKPTVTETETIDATTQLDGTWDLKDGRPL